MKIYAASDHRGFELKQNIVSFLKEQGTEVIDLGPSKYIESDDYSDSAIKVAKAVQKDADSRGLLLCGSGIGMYITANKFRGIRAAEIRSAEEAKEDRKHHDSNVLVIGADHNDLPTSKEILNTWLTTEFDAGRHERRIREIELIERENIKEARDGANIVPAILSDKLEDYVEQVGKYSKFSEIVNIDVMDGEFVTNKTPDVFEILDQVTRFDTLLSVHLMIKDPGNVMDKLEGYENILVVYVHAEVVKIEDLEKERPYEVALTFNPDTKVSDYKDMIEKVRTIQLMTVVPGAQGKEFRDDALDKQKELIELGFEGEIHIDGSVRPETLSKILENSKDVLNVGSAVTKSDNPEDSFKELEEKVEDSQKSEVGSQKKNIKFD